MKNIENIKQEFRDFLNKKVSRDSTIRQYLSWMNKVQEWFIDNRIVDSNFNIWIDKNKIIEIEQKLKDETQYKWKESNKPLKNWMSSPWNAWVAFNSNTEITFEMKDEEFENFKIEDFQKNVLNSGLIFSEIIIQRFVASLCTKPFVVLSGLSGSGKTKLAQSFVQWICKSEEQYKIIPVGADWTNREPLLGFPNSLNSKEYVMPDCGALQLILDAIKNENSPYFLILDEMNLSHVERYFADFLSSMESGEKIHLYSGTDRDTIPQTIYLPQNLFIIGTVNIDETTYMFSPKVLDRANVIEFRLNESDLINYFKNKEPLNLNNLKGMGQRMGESFIELALNKDFKNNEDVQKELILFFKELKKAGAEFGYRGAAEIVRLINQLDVLENKLSKIEKLDIAIMQKLLPKLHGSRSKLTKVLTALGEPCLENSKNIKQDYFEKFYEIDFENDTNIKYKLSFEKICRMYKNSIDNGFASYAEA